MKNHIVFKFIAILLCAAALLGAVGSGAGILMMMEAGLYQKNVEDAYRDTLTDYVESYAGDAALRYASKSLGNANDALLDSYSGGGWFYDMFLPGRIGYSISDADGNVLVSEPMHEGFQPEHTFLYQPQDSRYLKVHKLLTEEEYLGTKTLPEEITEPITEPYVYDAIPSVGDFVTSLYVQYSDGFAESAGGNPNVGFLDYDEDGNVRYTTDSSDPLSYNSNPITHIRFQSGETLLFEAKDPAGVGYFYHKGGTHIFRTDLAEMPDDLVDDATIPPDENGAVLSDQIPLVPDHGAKVYRADIWSPSVGTVIKVESDTGALGEVFLNSEGFLVFRCDGIFDSGFDTCFVRLIGEDGQLLFESYDRDAEIGQGKAVGKFVYDPDGKLIFTTDLNYGLSHTEEELPAEEPEVVSETVAATEIPISEPGPLSEGLEYTEPPITVSEPYDTQDMEIVSYYDQTTGQHLYALFTFEEMPDYTVQVQLAKGAYLHEQEWVLIWLLYSVKNQLPYVLGACLLLFAILAVYLCCAAGRKPGTKEIRPGGFNAIPLELYAAAAVGGVIGLLLLCFEGSMYLLRKDTTVGILCAFLCVYGASLLIVSFFFACAAQFKTPSGYWWRKSLIGRSVTFAGKSGRWLLKFSRWATKKWESRLWPGITRLFKKLLRVGNVLLAIAGNATKKVLQLLQRAGDWFWEKLSRFFALLPLTWQWLMAGGCMIFFLFITVAGRYDLGIILSVLFAVGLVMYGAHCFGTLLDSTKRMSKGNLEEKVDDKLMLGSFKDFAEELNGLADVAVVAAQKQLKSERMKTELITNVSHDIKTPLTSIINYVDLLQKPHTEAEQEKYLEVLDRQSQRLKKLIDDLMEMSKASTGNMSVDITRVDAAEAVNQALGEFADKLDKARLYPVFRQPQEPVIMMADGRLVWRVMSNLLSNAVKYALPGTRLYIDLQKIDTKVILSMKNISREELNMEADELLERFVRGDVSRNTEGSGLGLNIARSLMELQKGQLQILVDGDLFKVTLIFPGE